MIKVRELIDAELDGVCGGFFDTTVPSGMRLEFGLAHSPGT